MWKACPGGFLRCVMQGNSSVAKTNRPESSETEAEIRRPAAGPSAPSSSALPFAAPSKAACSGKRPRLKPRLEPAPAAKAPSWLQWPASPATAPVAEKCQRQRQLQPTAGLVATPRPRSWPSSSAWPWKVLRAAAPWPHLRPKDCWSGPAASRFERAPGIGRPAVPTHLPPPALAGKRSLRRRGSGVGGTSGQAFGQAPARTVAFNTRSS